MGGNGPGMTEAMILGSLVLIIGLLGFIALMIFVIGHNLDNKDKPPKIKDET